MRTRNIAVAVVVLVTTITPAALAPTPAAACSVSIYTGPPLPPTHADPSIAVPGLDGDPASLGVFGRRYASSAALFLTDGVVHTGGPPNSCGPAARSRAIGAVSTSAVEITSPYLGRVDVVTRGSDGAVWHAGATSDGDIGWERLGGQIIGTPTIAAGPRFLAVFARGTDGQAHLYGHSWAGQGWIGYSPFEGRWSSDLDVAYGGDLHRFPGADRFDIVGLGSHGLVCHASVDAPVECFPGTYTSSPTIAVEPGAAKAWIFVRGADNALYVNRFTNATGWAGWARVGGILTSAPDAAYVPGVGVRVAMLGTDGATWTTQGDTVFTPFTRDLPQVP